MKSLDSRRKALELKIERAKFDIEANVKTASPMMLFRWAKKLNALQREWDAIAADDPAMQVGNTSGARETSRGFWGV